MAWNLEGVSSFMFKWLSSFLFWGVLLFVLIVVVFGSLIIRKRRKLVFPAIELTDLGAGKIGFKTHKAGWFKSQTILFGLLDYAGEDVLKLKDGRAIQAGSSEDFHDINGKRGLLVVRKSDDPAILLPINKAGTSNFYEKGDKGSLVKRILGARIDKKEDPKLTTIDKLSIINPKLLAEIAPADYRDASVKIISATEKETRGKWEKLAPYVVFGTLAIIFMITIIMVVQMVKHGQAEAKDLLLEAGKNLITSANNVAPASVAP